MLRCWYPNDFNDGQDENSTEEQKVKSDAGNQLAMHPNPIEYNREKKT